MSDYLENRDLDIWYGATAFTKPPTIYVQAHTGDPGETGTANVHASFARIALTNNNTNFPAASGGVKQNGTEWSLGSTAGMLGLADWTHVSLWDALVGGNMLDYGALGAAVPTSDRVKVSIPAGSATWSRT